MLAQRGFRGPGDCQVALVGGLGGDCTGIVHNDFKKFHILILVRDSLMVVYDLLDHGVDGLALLEEEQEWPHELPICFFNIVSTFYKTGC